MPYPQLLAPLPDKTGNNAITKGTSFSFNASVYFDAEGTGAAPVLVNVPNIVGQTQANATTAITNAGLVLGTVSSTYSESVALGNVITQSPIAGTQVVTGSSVTLTVSLGAAGAPTVTVPNVVGLTQAAATSAITGEGLIVGTVTNTNSGVVIAGNIISQNPAAGEEVDTGDAVNIEVSLGVAGLPRFSLNSTTNPYYEFTTVWAGAQDELVTLTFTHKSTNIGFATRNLLVGTTSNNAGLALRVGVNNADKFFVSYPTTNPLVPTSTMWYGPTLVVGNSYTFSFRRTATGAEILVDGVVVKTSTEPANPATWLVLRIGNANNSTNAYIKDVILAGATDQRWYKLDDGFAKGYIEDTDLDGTEYNGVPTNVASTDWDTI